MSPNLFGQVFLTLVVILDPIGNIPVFLSLAQELGVAQRKRAANISVIVAFTLILVFAIFGQTIISYLKIGIPSLMIAGGFLLLLVSLDLMWGKLRVDKGYGDIAFVPMGTPLLAGPGAIVTVMVYMQQHTPLEERMVIVAAILASVLVIWVALRAAEPLFKLLGKDIINVISRLMGILIAAIAIELIHGALVIWVQDF